MREDIYYDCRMGISLHREGIFFLLERKLCRAVSVAVFLLATAPAAAITTAPVPINFGTIVPMSDTVVLTMDTGGTVRITGGSANLEGATSAGSLKIEAQTGRDYERIENISALSDRSVTLGECMVTLSSVTLGNTNPFSIAASDSRRCSNLPRGYDIPITAVLSITGGYCAEGTYSLTGVTETTWNEYDCSYSLLSGGCYGTSNCSLKNSFADIPITFSIKNPLKAREEQNLDFGTVISMPYQQNVTVAINGGISGGMIPNNSTTAREGRFIVSGALGKIVNITVPSSAKVINTQNSGAEMDVALQPGVDSILLSDTGGVGTGAFTVGGTLKVGANQPEGNYIGTYTVQVSY